jgi:hypothetical protein
MTFARFRLLALALLACAGSTLAREALADSVYLTNGARIDGKVTDNRSTSGKVVVHIGDAGYITLRAGQVDRIEMGGAPAAAAPAAAKDEAKAVPAVEGQRVVVTAPPKADYYGSRTYEGTISPESNDKTLVLEIPGPGKVYIPRGPDTIVTRATETAGAPQPAAATPESREVRTTHKIHLANGETLQGDLLPSAETEPVKLGVGRLGVLTIPRSKIAPNGIEKADGVIRLPEEPKAPEGGAPEQPPAREPLPAEIREEIKRELRSEILREVLDQIIEEKMQELYPAEPLRGADVGGDEEPLENEAILAIQDAVTELGRQRTRNRVRAEDFLVDAGSAALPYLGPAAKHPFPLTRRSVQRIIRDIGDVRGAVLSIPALDDPDPFVRQLAGEALAVLLPSDIAFDPAADPAEIRGAQAAYRALFEETIQQSLREAAASEVARE